MMGREIDCISIPSGQLSTSMLVGSNRETSFCIEKPARARGSSGPGKRLIATESPPSPPCQPSSAPRIISRKHNDIVAAPQPRAAQPGLQCTRLYGVVNLEPRPAPPPTRQALSLIHLSE